MNPGQHLVGVYGILLRDAQRTATLTGWRLSFGTPGQYGYPFATLIPEEGAQVVLGIVETTAEGVYRYDAIEGCDDNNPLSDRGFYRRELVQTDGGEWVWVYAMNRPVERQPDQELVTAMFRQYERLGIPMRQLVTAQVPR